MLGEAGMEFQIAGRINLSSPDPMIHLGGVYILRKEWEPVSEASVEAIRRDPREPQGYFQLGVALYCTATWDLAEGAFRTALNLDPKKVEARLLLVNLYLHSGKWNDALQQLKEYLQSNPRGEMKERVAALRDQLRRGERPAVGLAVPIRVGREVRKNVCGDLDRETLIDLRR
jgi:cytochrome c-type biogenesis protein CcmH/NrfG